MAPVSLIGKRKRDANRTVLISSPLWGGEAEVTQVREEWLIVRQRARTYRCTPTVSSVPDAVECRRAMSWSASVLWVRMRGEAVGRKTGGRSAGSYPPISAAYWLPPSNPTPYHVPGSVIHFHSWIRCNFWNNFSCWWGGFLMSIQSVGEIFRRENRRENNWLLWLKLQSMCKPEACHVMSDWLSFSCVSRNWSVVFVSIYSQNVRWPFSFSNQLL